MENLDNLPQWDGESMSVFPPRTDKVCYSDIVDEFIHNVPEWYKLERFVRDAIVRDALGRLTEFQQFWQNDPRATQNGRLNTVQAFVHNYIETVNRFRAYTNLTELTMWDLWGEKLRALEVG